MESSIRFGFMIVFAVSGSVVFLVHQVHKHMLKNFMKKLEFEIRGVDYPHGHKCLHGSKKHQTKKTVRFAEEVLEIPIESKIDFASLASRTQQQVKEEKVLAVECVKKLRCGHEFEDIMPPNRAAL